MAHSNPPPSLFERVKCLFHSRFQSVQRLASTFGAAWTVSDNGRISIVYWSILWFWSQYPFFLCFVNRRVERLENLKLSQLCDWSLCVLKNWMLLLDSYREAKKLKISSIQSAWMNQWIYHGCMAPKINLKPSKNWVIVVAVALAPLIHRKQS